MNKITQVYFVVVYEITQVGIRIKKLLDYKFRYKIKKLKAFIASEENRK